MESQYASMVPSVSRPHSYSKTFKFSPLGKLSLSGKVTYNLRIPEDCPVSEETIVLDHIAVIANPERKINCHLDMYVAEQRASGIEAFKRLLHLLDSNLSPLDLDSIQHDQDDRFCGRTDVSLRLNGMGLANGLVPPSTKTATLEDIVIRITCTPKSGRGKTDRLATEDDSGEEGFGDQEEEDLLQDLSMNRLSPVLDQILNRFFKRFLGEGLTKQFPLIFNGRLKHYCRREARGIVSITTSVRRMFEQSNNKAFKKEGRKIYKRLGQADNARREHLRELMPDEAEDTDDEDEEDEQTKFERLLSEGMLRMCLAKQSGVSVKFDMPPTIEIPPPCTPTQTPSSDDLISESLESLHSLPVPVPISLPYMPPLFKIAEDHKISSPRPGHNSIDETSSLISKTSVDAVSDDLVNEGYYEVAYPANLPSIGERSAQPVSSDGWSLMSDESSDDLISEHSEHSMFIERGQRQSLLTNRAHSDGLMSETNRSSSDIGASYIGSLDSGMSFQMREDAEDDEGILSD